MNQTNHVIAVVGWDNRQPLPDDVANQLTALLSNGVYLAKAVTITVLVQATMVAPTAGSNQIAIELVSPSGTSNGTIVAWVTACINALSIPTVASVTVNSVTVF